MIGLPAKTKTLVGVKPVTAETIATPATRWKQLVSGIVCMVLIANLQYGWTLFVTPINKSHGWSIAAIQLAFSIFIALETWLTPIQGWIVDILGANRGPKLMIASGGIMVALGWVTNAYAQSLSMLYLGAISAGIGGGAVYATCVGLAVKWFPDRRGLAVGLTAAGYGVWRSDHRHPDPLRDRQLRLQQRFPLVRDRARRRHLRARIVFARARGR
jgi:Major Facilitator Superfamily